MCSGPLNPGKTPPKRAKENSTTGETPEDGDIRAPTKVAKLMKFSLSPLKFGLSTSMRTLRSWSRGVHRDCADDLGAAETRAMTEKRETKNIGSFMRPP